jgi:hypothetical protein
MRSWLNNRKEEKLAELSQSTNKAAFDTVSKAFDAIQAVSSDTSKIALVEAAAANSPVVNELRIEAEKAWHSLVKHASQTDASINGVNIPAEVGQKVTRETRSSTNEERKDGVYRVQKVDT